MRWLDGITDSTDMFEQAVGVGDGQGMLLSMGSQRVRQDLVNELNSVNWTEWMNEMVGGYNQNDIAS